MKRYLETPQLPAGRVSLLAMGACYINDYSPILTAYGIEVLPIYGTAAVDPRLQGHADLLLLHLGGDSFWAAKGVSIHNKLSIQNYVNLFENEAALNLCILGKYWIGSVKHAAWQPEDLVKISVKQRYSRCSTCIVDEHSIITSDHGIARAAGANGIDVLEICPGHIRLDGFDYGFIGGASFKIASDKLAFTGSLHHHPDEERILQFLSEHGQDAVYLKNEPLRDIGSAVLIAEEIDFPLP